MNQEKLAKLQAQVRIGGKEFSKKKKLAVNNVAGTEEVQASLSANTFAFTGHAEAMPITEMLPEILSQLGADNYSGSHPLDAQFPQQVLDSKAPIPEDIGEEEEIPDLTENFDEASKNETKIFFGSSGSIHQQLGSSRRWGSELCEEYKTGSLRGLRGKGEGWWIPTLASRTAPDRELSTVFSFCL
ncbi:transcription factor BTF3 homolog 4-like [Molossus nigricans]